MNQTSSHLLRLMASVAGALALVSCGDKDEGNADNSNKNTKEPPAENTAPAPSLEEQMVGFWAADSEPMKAEMSKTQPGTPAATIEAIVASTSVEVPEKGKMVLHMMGMSRPSTYVVTATDAATKTLTAQVTEEGATEEGTATVDGDSLTIRKGDKTIYLTRIDSEEFSRRQEAAAKAATTLTEVKSSNPDSPSTPPHEIAEPRVTPLLPRPPRPSRRPSLPTPPAPTGPAAPETPSAPIPTAPQDTDGDSEN